jgi:hypothetical protein
MELEDIGEAREKQGKELQNAEFQFMTDQNNS